MIKLEIVGETIEQFHNEAMRVLTMLGIGSPSESEAPREVKANEPEPPKRRGRPKNMNGPIEPVAEILEPATRSCTREDCRDIVRRIVAEHNRRGNDMQASIEYVRKLFDSFGFAQISDIPEDRMAEFIAAAQPYLDGTA